MPANAIVAADRVNPLLCYAYANGTLYVSVDGAVSFTASPASGLPTHGSPRVKAAPGSAGDLWLAGGRTGSAYGLWHSTDAGTTFARVCGVEQADNLGFGAAAPGKSYPALYTFAKVDGVRGIYRSDDVGQSWVRVNDDRHQWGNSQDAITGDPANWGRVYFSAGGRGIMYGDPVDPAPPR